MRKRIKVFLARMLIFVMVVTQVQPMPVMAMEGDPGVAPEVLTELDSVTGSDSVVETTPAPTEAPEASPIPSAEPVQDMEAAFVQDVSEQSEVVVTDIEIYPTDCQNVFYKEVIDNFGFMHPIYSLKVQLTLSDGSTSICGYCDPDWNQYGVWYEEKRTDVENWDGCYEVGTYSSIIQVPELEKTVAFNYEIKPASEMTEVLTVENGVELYEGTFVCKLVIDEPGLYKTSKYVDLYDEFMMNWRWFDEDVLAKGTYIVKYDAQWMEAGELLTIDKISSTWEKGTTVPINGTAKYYKIEVDEPGNYLVVDEETGCEFIEVAVASNEFAPIWNGGSEMLTISQAGEYLLRIVSAKAEGQNVSMKKVTGIKLLKDPINSIFYRNIHPCLDAGIILGVVLEDNSCLEVPGDSVLQYDITRTEWTEDNALKIDAIWEAEAGNYKWVYTVNNTNISCESAFCIAEPEEAPYTLSEDTPQVTTYGSTLVKLNIEKAGQYEFTSSKYMSFSIYDSDIQCIGNTWFGDGGIYCHTFETPGTYYLAIMSDEMESDISFSREPEAEKVEISYSTGDGIYYYGIKDACQPENNLMALITYDNGETKEVSIYSWEWENAGLGQICVVDAITGEEIIKEDFYDAYSIGSYKIQIKENAEPYGVVAEVAFQVKDASEMEPVLKYGQSVGPFVGNEEQHWLKVDIEEPGVYRITPDNVGIIYGDVFSINDENEIESNYYYDNKVILVAKEKTTFYLSFSAFEENSYSLSLEKEPTAIKNATVENWKGVLYYELLYSTEQYMDGIRLQLEFEDGSTASCERWDDVWYDNIYTYGLRNTDGTVATTDDAGYYPVGEYIFYVQDNYYRDIVKEPLSIKNMKDTSDVLKVGEVNYDLGANVYKVNFVEDAFYKLNSNDSIYFYDSELNRITDWYQEALLPGEAGDVYYVVIYGYDYEDTRVLKTEPVKVIDLTMGEACTTDMEVEGNQIAYRFVPEKTAIHRIFLDNSSGYYIEADIVDSTGVNLRDVGSSGNFETRVNVEAGKNHYVYLASTAMDGTYSISVKKELEVKDLKIVRMPYRTELYYGKEYPDSYNDLEGLIIGVTYEDGTYAEFYEGSEHISEFTLDWRVLDTEGNVIDTYTYPVGDYIIQVSINNSTKKVEIPVSVVTLDTVEYKLSLDNPLLTMENGMEAIETTDYVAVEIAETGTYTFETDKCADISLYVDDYTSTGSNGYSFTYEFTESGTYYLRVSVNDSSYSLSMKKEPEVVGFDVEYTKGNGIYYYRINSDNYPLYDAQIKVTLEDGQVVYGELYSNTWYKYVQDYGVKSKLTDELISRDEIGYYPIGEYYIEVLARNGETVTLPMVVKSAAEMDTVLKPGEELTVSGEENTYTWKYMRFSIEEAGQYYLDLSTWNDIYLYNEEFDYSIYDNGYDLVFEAEEAGNYILKLYGAGDTTISAEKLKTLTGITLENCGTWVSYYGLDNGYYTTGKKYTAHFEDGTSETFDMGYCTTERDAFESKYGVLTYFRTADDDTPSWDEQGNYPIGEYTISVGSDSLGIKATKAFVVRDKADIPDVLRAGETITGLPGDEVYGFVKLVFAEPGIYSFESTENSSYEEGVWDENLNPVLPVNHRYSLNGMRITVTEPCTYYMSCYAYNPSTYDVTMKKEPLPKKMEVGIHQNQYYEVGYLNNINWLDFEFLMYFDDGSSTMLKLNDYNWQKYNLTYAIYKADNLTTPYTNYSFPIGDYVFKTWSVENSLYEVQCEVPFAVVTADKAPKLALNTDTALRNRTQLYRLDITESGLYQVFIKEGTGSFVLYDTDGKYVGSFSDVAGYGAVSNIEKGSYYLRTIKTNHIQNSSLTFAVKKLPNVNKIAYNESDKLEIKYGTWGYYVSTVSGNNYVSTSGDNKPMVPGAKVTGMKTRATDMSGNNIISGNTVFNERVTVGVTLEVTLADGTVKEMFFNSPVWDAYGIWEELYNEDGTPIYADEHGYMPMGDYIIEFSAQGQSVKIPLSVIEAGNYRDIRKATVTIEAQDYTGEPITPKPVVKYGNDILILGTDYMIRYENNVNSGTAKAILRGKGKYSGTLEVEFEIAGSTFEIIGQPVDVTVAKGAVASVSVTATGDGLKYQWYYTSNGKDNTFYKSSNTTNTYTTTMSADRDGRKVYCVVTDKYGNKLTSNTVTLKMKVENVVKITKQPVDVTVAKGATATVSVTATGDGLKYQWYYTSNGSSSYFNKSSNTTNTYSTSMDATRDGRKVYCVVMDKNGNKVTSNTVTLKMKADTAVKITKQPVDVTVSKGATATVSVTASGDGLKYQWYYTSNGSTSYFNKSSNTTNTYSTSMDATRDGRKVYCVVTDKYGNKVTSNTVTLKMKTDTAVKITKQPVGVSVAKGATATVSVTATGEGLKYQWYYTSNGSSSYFNKSSNTTNTYSTSMDATRDGRKVYCVVTDKYGNKVTSNTVTLTMKVENAVKITKQPVDVTVAKGATATVSVTATGEGLKYQWYYTSNGSASYFNKSSNTTNTYSTSMDATRDGRKVYCVVTDKNGNKVTSNTVTLKMSSTSAVKITKQPVGVSVAKGATATVSVTATGEGLKYQWYYTSNGSTSYFNKSSNTTNTYSTTMDATRDGRKVYCVVTDKNGNKVTSNTVSLKMSK